MNFNHNKSRTEFTEIDTTTTGRTTIYNVAAEAFVSGVYFINPSSSARVRLEVFNTEGNEGTVFVPANNDGNNIRFGDDIVLGENDQLRINVTSAGSSGTQECVVFATEG